MLGDDKIERKAAMGAKKLEWKVGIDPMSNWWRAGRYEIRVTALGHFRVNIGGDWLNLPDAKAWCEKQEKAAQPAEPMPAVGSVWGVPDKPETRRFVVIVRQSGSGLFYASQERDREISLADWQSWVRDSGAVDLIADRAELVRRAEVAEAIAGEAKRNAANADLLRIAAVQRETSLKESIAKLAKERDELRAKLDRTESRNEILERRFADYRDCMDLAGEIAEAVSCYDSDDLPGMIGVHLMPLIAERDRYAAALQGIENTPPAEFPDCVSGWAAKLISDMERLAREALRVRQMPGEGP